MRFEPGRILPLVVLEETFAAADEAAAIALEKEGVAEEVLFDALPIVSVFADLVADVIGLMGVDLGRMKDNIARDRCTHVTNQRDNK